jgi:dTDP-4-dehydrorhamnose reductase
MTASVCVIGATGFIGARIHRRLIERAGDHFAVSGTGLRRAEAGVNSLDVTDAAALASHVRRGFDVIVVAAGTKDVGACEREPAGAIALNATPVERIVESVRRDRLPTRVVYLSTDYVFEGDRGSYREEDRPAARTAYGRSKLAGERAVLLDEAAGHKVVRSAAVSGRGARFFDWLVAELRAGREVRLFDDCFFSPTPAELLADSVVDLVLAYDEVPGRIVHAVGDRRMSRLELGQIVAASLGSRGRVVADRRASGGPLFQRDLSLEPSPWVRARQRASLEEYLAREVR